MKIYLVYLRDDGSGICCWLCKKEKRTHRCKCLHKEAICHNCGKTGHFKAVGWSKLNKKQNLEWHVEEESSQDELQLLVKSRFIPYGRCTCSLRIDSSKFCSRRWFIADEYPQLSRSGRYNVLRSVLWVIINKIPFVPCEIMCVWSSLWSICPLHSLYLLKSMCPLCSLCLVRSASPLYFLFLVRLVCPLCTRNTVDTRSSISPNTKNTLDTRISPNTTNKWTQGSHQTQEHSGHKDLIKLKGTVDTRISPNTRNTVDTRISPNTRSRVDTGISPNTRNTVDTQITGNSTHTWYCKEHKEYY